MTRVRKSKKRPLEYHGLTSGGKQLPEYQIWSQIKQWCLNKNHKKYSDYGGRGIKIHSGWVHSFVAFLNEVGPRPSKEYRLFRIDFDRGYLPGNVRWATATEHARNVPSNRIVIFQGEKMALAQAAEMAGIDRKRLHDRLERGFSTRDAFERPVEGGMRYITWKGEEHNIAVWARKLKISYQTLHSRIYKMGWDVDRAFSTPSAKTGK